MTTKCFHWKQLLFIKEIKTVLIIMILSEIAIDIVIHMQLLLKFNTLHKNIYNQKYK